MRFLNDRIVRFSIIIFSLHMMNAVLSTQLLPYMIEIGYTNMQRGIILSSISLLTMIIQTYIGYLSDKLGMIKRIVIILIMMLIPTAIISYMINLSMFWFHLTIFSLMQCIIRTAVALGETWVFEREDMQQHFGLTRAFGSLGGASAAYISGILVVRVNYLSIGVFASLVGLLLLFVSFGVEDVKKVKINKLKISEITTLLKNKNYILIIVVFSIFNISSGAFGQFLVDRIYELGGNSETLGLYSLIASSSEIPLLLTSTFFLLKYGSKNITLFALFMSFVRFMIYGLTSSNTIIISSSFLQMFTLPFIIIGQRSLLYNEIPRNISSSGQLFAISIIGGLSGILAPLIAGFLQYFISPQVGILLCGFSFLISFSILLPYRET